MKQGKNSLDKFKLEYQVSQGKSESWLDGLKRKLKRRRK